MKDPRLLRIDDFNYDLPDQRIAKFPRKEREHARLLIFEKKAIKEGLFPDITGVIRKGDMLVINETRVIPARLLFYKETGAEIEIFCLQPKNADHTSAMSAKQETTWEVLIGNAKKWKDGFLRKKVMISDLNVVLLAERMHRESGEMIVRFSWDNDQVSFSEIISACGELPLPPYFERKAEEDDYQRYQTVFARFEGSVAAPTAGLHFTSAILNELETSGVVLNKLTLHVGSGTFKPVSTAEMADHEMHGEFFSVSRAFLQQLLTHSGRIIPVGTTSMRTLESLYWIGLKLKNGAFVTGQPISLKQWEPYGLSATISPQEAIQTILDFLTEENKNELTGSTSVMIAPGYEFKFASGLVTNFHLPKSTLILLIAGLIGENWKEVYDYALQNEFNFLSYGDSSILIP
ncbi:MAG: S-adenosylmethionine:tRNA ribosyltransferase-isomerase [Flavobacteriales bacterium]